MHHTGGQLQHEPVEAEHHRLSGKGNVSTAFTVKHVNPRGALSLRRPADVIPHVSQRLPSSMTNNFSVCAVQDRTGCRSSRGRKIAELDGSEMDYITLRSSGLNLAEVNCSKCIPP